MRGMLIAIHMKVNFTEGNPMAKEYIGGLMENYMRVNGIREWSMVTVFGKEEMVINISVNGETQRLKVMVCIFGRMERGMKENGKAS